MRILAALTYYHPHWTGLTMIARALADGLAERGHQVTVVATRHERELPARARIGGVTVIRVPSAGRLSRAAVAPTLIPTVLRLLRAHDVLHLHTPMPEAWPLAAAARRIRQPVLMTHHGDVVMPPGLVNRAIERSFAATLARAGRVATHVTTHSGDYAAHSALLRPLREKLTAIHPPVALPAPDLAAAAELRAQLGLQDRPVVGFAGRFVEEKGFDRLLRAIPPLVARHRRVQLVYAGQAMFYEPFYDRCRPLLDRHAARITELGLIEDRQRLANFYAMCDVLAVPSRTECWGIVQAEAMRCGTPVVTSDIPGAREAVHAGGCGRVVASDDADALAGALGDVIDDPARLIGLGPPPFEPSVAIDAYEDVLAALR